LNYKQAAEIGEFITRPTLQLQRRHSLADGALRESLSLKQGVHPHPDGITLFQAHVMHLIGRQRRARPHWGGRLVDCKDEGIVAVPEPRCFRTELVGIDGSLVVDSIGTSRFIVIESRQNLQSRDANGVFALILALRIFARC
jgi:hypothetical protein